MYLHLSCFRCILFCPVAGTFNIHLQISSLQVNGSIRDSAIISAQEKVGRTLHVFSCYINSSRSTWIKLKQDKASGLYLNGHKISGGSLGIALTSGLHQGTAAPRGFWELLWPSVTTRNLEGRYTCVAGNDRKSITVKIISKFAHLS